MSEEIFYVMKINKVKSTWNKLKINWKFWKKRVRLSRQGIYLVLVTGMSSFRVARMCGIPPICALSEPLCAGFENSRM